MPTLPTPQDFSNIEINSVFPGMRVDTDTGKSYRLNFSTHFFTVQVTYPAMDRNEVRQVMGFLQGMQGSLTEFDCPLGIYSDTAGARATLSGPADKTLTVDANASVGDSAITYNSNWTNAYYTFANDNNFLQVGDYITFSNHNKVYVLTDVTNPNSSGDGGFSISPGLQETITTSETIDVTNVTMKVFLDGDTMQFSTGAKGFSQLAFNFKEDV